MTKELLWVDLYTLLGTVEKAADKEVKKAYRQKALSCHSDKNQDNPRAGELIHQLSQALQVLTNTGTKTVNYKVRKAKKWAAERTQKSDERRKKLKLATAQMSSYGFFKSMERCSTQCFAVRRQAPPRWSLQPPRLRNWLSRMKRAWAITL